MFIMPLFYYLKCNNSVLLSSFTQLKSNVVSVDSHVGQYAVICEKQKAEVRIHFCHVYVS